MPFVELTGSVGFTDFMRMTQHFTQSVAMNWGRGDFNYDGTVDVNDFNLLQPNYGQSLPAPAPAMTPIVLAASTTTPPPPGGTDPIPIVATSPTEVTQPVKAKKLVAKVHGSRKRH